LVAVALFDMLSLGDADVVPDAELEGDDDEDDDEDGEVLGDMLLELLDVLPDGELLVADDVLEVSVELEVDDGDVVEGLIVPVLLELDDGEVLGVVVDELELVDGVVDGVVVVDDVLLVSRWQPAAPSATVTAIATTARGFGFMWSSERRLRGDGCAATSGLAGSVPRAAHATPATPPVCNSFAHKALCASRLRVTVPTAR
jgi:hypothetical protein